MKYPVFLFSIMIALSAHSIGQTKVYAGNLNNKAIEMHLRFAKDAIYGYYFYKGKDRLIPLFTHGSSTKIKIMEYEDTDDLIYFDATINEHSITGDWKDEEEKKQYPFSITQTGTEQVDKGADAASGDYMLEDKKKRMVKDLTLCYINKTDVYFEIAVRTPECTGNMNGIIKAEGNNKLQYSNKACSKLSFLYTNNAMKVKEFDCTPHGPSCDFNGKYMR